MCQRNVENEFNYNFEEKIYEILGSSEEIVRKIWVK